MRTFRVPRCVGITGGAELEEEVNIQASVLNLTFLLVQDCHATAWLIPSLLQRSVTLK